MTSDNWNEVLIKDLIEAGHAETKTGPFGTQLKASQYVDSGTPVINVRNIGFGIIRPEKLEFIGPDTVGRLSSHLLREDDIVFGRKGAVERHAFIRREQRNWFQGSDCLRLRFNGNGTVLPRFVSYFLLTEEHKQWMMNQCSHGATMASLNQDIIARIRICLPPLTTQRKIASILSAYDDLIENNTRRIAILEEMAQAIYREWFVNFRFPGHETVKLVDSTLGMIPEGWRITTLEEITTKIGSGATPTGGKNAYKEFGITLIRSLNVYDFNFDDDGLAFIDDQQAAQLVNVTVERHDILLNITGASVARCCMVRADLLPARVNQHVAIIRTDTNAADPFFVLSAINSERYKKQLLALSQGGATREALTKATIQGFQILLPPTATIHEYGKLAEGIFEQREILQRKNINLRTTRDLLLPKLISGKLDVEDLDIDVGMTAEEVAEAAAGSFNGEP